MSREFKVSILAVVYMGLVLFVAITPDDDHVEKDQGSVMTDFISVEDSLPDEDTLVVGVDLSFPDETKPAAAVFWFLHGEFHVWVDGLDAENYDGGAIIHSTMTITHWKYLL